MIKSMTFTAILAAGLLTGTASAQADPQDQCQQAQGFAQQVMKQRQQGVSQDDQIQKLTSAGQIDDEQKAALKQLVSAAYDQPRHEDEADQKKEIQEFGQRAHQGCTQELQKQQ